MESSTFDFIIVGGKCGSQFGLKPHPEPIGRGLPLTRKKRILFFLKKKNNSKETRYWNNNHGRSKSPFKQADIPFFRS